MLDICASVGARAVDLTLASSSSDKEWFRRDLSLAELGRMLPAMLDDATTKKHSIIIRPHGPEITLLELNDLKARQLPGVAFVDLETSPPAASARARATRLKAKLNALHTAGPDEFLTGEWRPPGIQPPAEFTQFQPALPVDVQKRVARAGELLREKGATPENEEGLAPARAAWKPKFVWITEPRLRRKHRATGRRKGRSPNDDVKLAAGVNSLAKRVGLPAARRAATRCLAVTRCLIDGVKMNPDSATARVRRALRNYPSGT